MIVELPLAYTTVTRPSRELYVTARQTGDPYALTHYEKHRYKTRTRVLPRMGYRKPHEGCGSWHASNV